MAPRNTFNLPHNASHVPTGQMLLLLEHVMDCLPELIKDTAAWQSLNINDEYPHTHRLWRQLGDLRVYLHKLHPCPKKEVFFHPHPWPCAMQIVAGRYEMGMCYGGNNQQPPPMIANYRMVSGCQYEMTHKDAWHFVRPLEKPCYTVMITGLPWNKSQLSSGRILTPLTPALFAELFAYFSHYFTTNG